MSGESFAFHGRFSWLGATLSLNHFYNPTPRDWRLFFMNSYIILVVCQNKRPVAPLWLSWNRIILTEVIRCFDFSKKAAKHVGKYATAHVQGVMNSLNGGSYGPKDSHQQTFVVFYVEKSVQGKWHHLIDSSVAFLWPLIRSISPHLAASHRNDGHFFCHQPWNLMCNLSSCCSHVPVVM